MGDAVPAPVVRGMPDQIGRYRIVSRIGRGAMGVVYSAMDEMTERPVALKVLIADLESDPETRARFYREAQAAARLLHPNVITVYDAGDDLGRSFIAMQLLDGAPLPAYLKRPEAESLDRKLDLMIQVCEGLAAAHAEGVIHRDLKPNNLFVQSDGQLKILDFGVARLADSSMTAVGTILGTPDYMSPEQARSDQVDVRSDIFSVGAVFYFMLAGRKPFPGPDLPAILRQLQFEEPVPLRGVPPELATIVTQAMAKNPDHRPGRVEQLLADLVRFRRQFQADTRRMAYNLRTEFEDLQTLTASLGQVARDLGLPEEMDDPLATIRQDHPFLTLGVTEPIPSDRLVLNGLALLLQGHRESFTTILEMRYAALAQLQEGEAALASGDATAASAAFAAVLAQCPGGRAVDLLARARAMDATQDAVAEQRRVTQLVEQALARAAAAIEAQAFDQAEAALDEATTWQPDSPAIAAARHRLAHERAAVEAAERLRAVSVDAIRRARSAFRRGRYEDAIHQLDSFLMLEPAADLVAADVEHLRRLHAAISQSAARADAIVQSSIAAATAARDQQAFDVAQQALLDALGADPTNAAAIQLLEAVLSRDLEIRLARERARTRELRLTAATAIMAAATAAHDRGYPDVALRSALAAQRLTADIPEVVPFIEERRLELCAEDEQIFPLESMPMPNPTPGTKTSRATAPDAGVLGWAADLFRTGLRRRLS